MKWQKCRKGRAALKKTASLVLTVSIVASSAINGASQVHAAGAAQTQTPDTQSQGAASASYEPWKDGYRFVDVLNWDPSTDPYAQELRARVPLQKRNEPFTATQADPNLKSDAQLYAISSGNYRSTDVNEAPWNGNQSYDDFSYNDFKFWQYTDFVGAGGRPTSGVARGSDWKEYGTISVPIAAYVNAAHKNGARALGEYFMPRNPQYTEEWLYKDANGNYPYAQKLIDIMNYYGFDGYFINQESGVDTTKIPLFKAMLAWMRSKGCYIQWYDSLVDSGGVSYQNQFNSTNRSWVLDDTFGRVSDSMFLNYWNNASMLKNSNTYAKSLGLDPLKAVFYGIEGGQWGFSRDLDGVLDETGNPLLSMSIWGSDFYHEQYNKDNDNRYKSGYQWQAEERERMYFTSPKEDASDHSTAGVNRSDVGVSSSALKGMSRYIAERSVINGSIFATDFNNGHGMQYFQNGRVSRNMEWTNVNLQDILPTWQWWVESAGSKKLALDWDYGPKEQKILADGTVSKFDYQQLGAYNGGSSLAIYGDLQADNFVNLYKTDLNVTADSKISLTYNKPSADDSSTMKLGLILKKGENETEKVTLDIPDSGKKTDGWKTVTLSLADYAGRDIAAIGLDVSSTGPVSNYQVNLGQLKLSDGKNYTPAPAKDFKIDKVFDSTGEIELSWNLDDYSTTKLYHVYASYKDGSERFVGGVYADNYYIQKLEDRANVVSLKLRAVGADGSESEAVSADLSQGSVVSNIQTASQGNKLQITYDEPDAAFSSVKVTMNYWYSKHTETKTATASKGAGKVDIDVPLEDGSKYTLSIVTVNADGTENQPVNYFGQLSDHYSEPFDGSVRVGGNGDRIDVTTPLASDWSKLYLTVDGKEQTFTRENNSLHNISVNKLFQNVEIVVEDQSGNKSEPVQFLFRNGKQVDPTAEISAQEIPDNTLRYAVIAQAGKTIGDVMKYAGALNMSGLAIQDYTGLDYLMNVSALDISNSPVSDLAPFAKLSNLKTLAAQNTQIETVKADVLPISLESLDLSESSKLTAVEKDAISKLTNLTKLDLSHDTALTALYLNNTKKFDLNLDGCTAIQELYLTGTAMSEIDISGFTKLTRFYGDNSKLEKIVCDNPSSYTGLLQFDIRSSAFDLSEGTPERKLLDFLKPLIPSGIYFDGQRPAVYLGTLPESVTVRQNGAELRTKDYFEKRYADAQTIRGTKFASLKGADWIAADYDIDAQTAVPDKVYVQITDSNGNIVNQPETSGTSSVDTDTNIALNARVLAGSGENSSIGEGYAQMLDGNTATKWCTGGNSGWVAFALGEAASVGKWVTTHAQINNEPASYNTQDFELQILNTGAIGKSEDEFLASGDATNRTILGNDANWTTIDHVTGNTAMTVERDINGADEARVYRLKVNKSINGTSNAAVRVHELELYAADSTPRDYDGILTLDKAGAFKVDFMKGKNTLGSMVVKVVADKETLNGLIAKCDALNEADYTPNSWTAFTEKLKDIKAISEKEYASQSEVDGAFISLLNAREELVQKAQKEALALGIELAGQQDLSHCTPDSITALNAALDKARQMLDDANATQDGVDAASTALYKAITGLTDIADHSRLVQLVEAAGKLDAGRYTRETAEAFQKALSEAQKIAGDQNATAQQIDEAYQSLAKAITALEPKVNTQELENIIKMSEDILANIGDYKPSTVKGLKEAVDAAKKVLADPSATQQAVNDAAKALAKVVAQVRAGAVKAEIVSTVAHARAINTALYTAQSVKELQTALAAADAAIKDGETSQETVDAANTALQQAIDHLVPIRNDASADSDETSSGNGGASSESAGTSSDSGSASEAKNPSTGSSSGLDLFSLPAFLLACSAGLAIKRRKRR